jgi:hypothetical protein
MAYNTIEGTDLVQYFVIYANFAPYRVFTMINVRIPWMHRISWCFHNSVHYTRTELNGGGGMVVNIIVNDMKLNGSDLF